MADKEKGVTRVQMIPTKSTCLGVKLKKIGNVLGWRLYLQQYPE